MVHSNGPEAGPSATRPRIRLTREGSTFLSNYARTISSYPKRTEKECLLASLRAIPGNDTFTIEKLNSWFARHRNLSRPPILVDEEIILFPKLTPMHLQQLRVLYKKRTDPSEGIITFWASRISADRQEVVAWIEYQQEKAKENDHGATPESPDIPLQQLVGDAGSESASASSSPTLSGFPRPHLPTPAKSLSPAISQQTRMPSLPPIAVKLEESRQCVSPVSSLSTPSLLQPARPAPYHEPRNALEGLPPLSRLPAQQTKLPPIAVALPSALFRVGGQHWRDSNASLAATIRDSLRPDATPSEQSPRTVDEFAAKFEAVERMMDAFVRKHESGQLVRLGWDPTFSHAAS